MLGAIRRDDAVVNPSRHLGLIPAAERGAEAVRAVERLGELVAESCDVEGCCARPHRSSPPGPVWDPSEHVEPVDGRPVVAVAGGAAFTFSYREHVELLRAAGADVVVFDPLRDEALPGGTAALVIGGGFPEVHAAELAANTRLLGAVQSFAGPIAAECARPPLSMRGTRRDEDVRARAGAGADDVPADARLPGGRRGRGVAADPRG